MYVASNGIKTAVILQDDHPFSPREYDNVSHMICWHRRYNLGDKHNFADAQEFAEALAKDHLKIRDVFSMARDGRLSGYRLTEVDKAVINGIEIGPHYQLEALEGFMHQEWRSTGWRCGKDLGYITSGGHDFEVLLESFTTSNLLKMLEASNEVAIKPLFLYDHSVQSISTGSFVGRAQHAEWDSGPCGFIYMTKDEAIKELAAAADTFRIAMVFTGEQQEERIARRTPSMGTMDLSELLVSAGYEQVKDPALIRNLYANAMNVENPEGKPLINPGKIELGCIFKKDHTLYEFTGWTPDHSARLRSIASFNPDLMRLTEETWRDRAEEVMEADVKAYDCYLQGEIYGFQQYEGLDEVDSCWGFNPGDEDIRDLMKSEMFGWWEPGMKFIYEGGESFDIEEFYDGNDFPELRNRIREDVKSFITFESETSVVFPFAMSAEEILSNKYGVLTSVVDEIYDTHEEWDTERIYSTVQDHAGISRELLPKISREDLEPGRDYTEQEMNSLFAKKASLADQIAGAASRQSNHAASHPPKDLGPNR